MTAIADCDVEAPAPTAPPKQSIGLAPASAENEPKLIFAAITASSPRWHDSSWKRR